MTGFRMNYVSIIGRTGSSQSSRIQVHHQKWLVDALRQIDVIRGKNKGILDEPSELLKGGKMRKN